MNKAEKTRYKEGFKNELDAFANKLEAYVTTDNGDWAVKGFIDVYKNIYTISSTQKLFQKFLKSIFSLKFYNSRTVLDIKLFSQKNKTGILTSLL